jgi:hypothetical protein
MYEGGKSRVICFWSSFSFMEPSAYPGSFVFSLLFIHFMYQNGGNIQKLPLNYQMTIKYLFQMTVIYIFRIDIKRTNHFHFKALQNLLKLGFWVLKYTIWQPCCWHQQSSLVFLFSWRPQFLSLIFKDVTEMPISVAVVKRFTFRCLSSTSKLPTVKMSTTKLWSQKFRNYKLVSLP